MTAHQSGMAAEASFELSPATLSRLPVRPIRYADESSEGHWLRVAHSNGLADPKWLLDGGPRSPLSIVRVCPQCIDRPDHYWRADWKDRSKPFCIAHGLWLVDRCGGCGRLLRWSGVGFVACRCGQALSGQVGVAISAQITQVLREGAAPLSVLLWLGAMTTHGLAMKPLKKASRVVMSEVVELAEAGALVVLGWPDAFFEVLTSSRQDGSKPDGLRSLNDALPGLTKQITRLRDEHWRQRIREALGAYVVASQQSAAPLVGKNVPGERPPTVAQLARELGMRPASLVAALDRLPGVPVASRATLHGRHRRLVSVDAARQAERQRIDEVSIKEAAKRTGLSSVRIWQLINAGLLEERRRRLSRREIYGLLQSLFDADQTSTHAADAISVRRALRYYVPIRFTPQFVRSIQCGALAVSVPASANTLSEVMVSEQRCRHWLANLVRADIDGLTIPEGAEVLRLKQEVVYHLVRVGLLRTCTARIGPHRTALVVTIAAIERFQRGYESLARLAAAAGVNPRSALNWATTVGLRLVSGPTIDGGRQYFALRPQHPSDK